MKQEPAATSAGTTAVTQAPRRSRGLWLPLALGVSAASWLIARGGYYTPGSELGYWMGVVGALMMVALLLYPLRKHVGFLRGFGALTHWFRLHMIFGIAGPTLILLHSTFHVRSLNAAVALFCMLLVAASGVVGRFIYRHIHHGLYGRRATLQEVQMLLGNSAGEVRSNLHFAPAVEQWLKAFETAALSGNSGFFRRILDFLTLALRAELTRLRCSAELSRILARHAKERGWPTAKLKARRRAAAALVHTYLRAVQRTAQFSAYERLFSLWHVVHVPFVYMLVISGIVHVIAVHMY